MTRTSSKDPITVKKLHFPYGTLALTVAVSALLFVMSSGARTEAPRPHRTIGTKTAGPIIEGVDQLGRTRYSRDADGWIVSSYHRPDLEDLDVKSDVGSKKSHTGFLITNPPGLGKPQQDN